MLSVISSKRTRVTPIGLDVGQSAVRAVQLRKTGEKYELFKSARVELKEESGGSVDSDAMVGKVSRLLSQCSFSGRQVVAGVGAPDAEIHNLDLPEQAFKGSASQLNQAVKVELSRLMTAVEPVAVQTAHWTLPSSRGSSTASIGIAVPRSYVQSLWNLCREAGLVCRVVDAYVCAISRFGWVVRGQGRGRQNEVWGILDLGHRGARLVLCVGNSPVLVRSLDQSGQAWTEAIASALEISPASAEIHKRDHGVTTGSRSDVSGNVDSAAAIGGMIFNTLRRGLDGLVAQIERSYAYVMQCYPQCAADGLILVGGGAAMKNLDVFLSDKLGIAIEHVDKLMADGGRSDFTDGRNSARRQPVAELASAIGLVIE